ncbi:hypothetical protein ACHAW6_012336 [Cyclotella cf. meneghiniana]
MSVGKTCNDSNIFISTQDGATVHKEHDVLITCKGEPILVGMHDKHGCYRIPLIQHKGNWQPCSPSEKAGLTLQHAKSVYDLPSTKEAIEWMHAMCGYPGKSTWAKAAQAGNLIGWLLLTAKNIQKYYPDTTETPKGHLNQTRTNVRSTKPKPVPLEAFHSPHLKGRKVRDVFTKVYNVCDTVFTNQTGKFSQHSQSGNFYVMVLVEIDSSAILVEPIKNRSDSKLTHAYSLLMPCLCKAGITPCRHVLDNEISNAMKTLITDTYKMTYKLVPLGCYCHSAVEVAIRNFKSHFLSILAGVTNNFPLQLWDKLHPQAKITVNLLQQSNAKLTISARPQLNGPFDYNKMPLAPTVCNTQVHKKSDSHDTWAFHSVEGWYLGTSPEHYRTHHCHIKATNRVQLSGTVLLQHKHITSPTLTPTNKLMQAIADCASALKGIVAPSKDITTLKCLLTSASTQLNTHSSLRNMPSTPIIVPRVLPSTTHPVQRVDATCITPPTTPSTVSLPHLHPSTRPRRKCFPNQLLPLMPRPQHPISNCRPLLCTTSQEHMIPMGFPHPKTLSPFVKMPNQA